MRSNVSGYSPHCVMYGGHPFLPIDIEFGVQTPDLSTTTAYGYVHKLQKRLEWAYYKAQDVNEKEHQYYK